MANEYMVANPAQGPASWLAQVVFLNGMQTFGTGVTPQMLANRPDFGIARWSNADALIAERIMRREFERVGGLKFASSELLNIEEFVQAVAMDGCGVFSARLVTGNPAEFGGPLDFQDYGWWWAQWARLSWQFARALYQGGNPFGWTARISSNDCSGRDLLGELSDTPLYVSQDPWYVGKNVWYLGATGPYTYKQAPPGYAGTFTPPPNEGLPPEQRTPGTLPAPPEPIAPEDQPPGTLPPPPTPITPADQPPGPATPPGTLPPPPTPVAYEATKKASGWQLLAASAIALTGIGLVAATVAMPKSKFAKAKPNPVAIGKEATERGLRWLRKELAVIKAEGPSPNRKWERNRQRAMRELRAAIRSSESELLLFSQQS